MHPPIPNSSSQINGFRSSPVFGVVGVFFFGVAVIATKAAAGDGFEYSDIPVEDYRFVFANGRNEKADAIIQVKGNSMLPVYHEDDWVYVQYTDSADIGEDFICSSRAGMHIKRLGEDLEIPDMQSFFRATSHPQQRYYPFEGALTLASRRQDNGEAGRLKCGDHGYSPPYA